MKTELFLGMLMMSIWAFGQTPAELQVEKTYKQAMKQLKKEYNLSEIHGKVYGDNSQWFILKSSDGHFGIATTAGSVVLQPKYNRIAYYPADANSQCVVVTKDKSQQLTIPTRPRQARFLSAIDEIGEIHTTDGSTLGSFLWKKGRSYYAIGNFLVYNYRKTNLKLRKNQKEDPNNSLLFHTDLSTYSDIGVMSLDGEELLPPLFNSITFYEASEEPSFTFVKDDMELTVPTEPHAARYVATGLEIGGLYDTDFNPLATFPGCKSAKALVLGNRLIYNFEYGGIQHEMNDITKPLTQFKFYNTGNNSNIGVMTTDGEEIFQPIYSNYVHNLPNHYIIVTSKAQGRQLEAGFNTENPDDYVPLKYHSVFRWINKKGEPEWRVNVKQLDTLELYTPSNPLPVVYANVLDSLYEYNLYQEGIDNYRKMTAPTDYDKWIASHCLYEQAFHDILYAKSAPETYRLIKYFDTNKSAPDFAKAKDMMTEALQLAKDYQEKLGDKANYIVKAFPEFLQKQLDGLPKVEADYKETAAQYKRDLDEAARAKAAVEAEKRARAEAAQRAREERIAQAWANVLSGFISGQVNRWMSSSSSGSSSSNSSGVRTAALPTTSGSSSSSSSSSDSGRGELVTVEKHVQCGGCKGSGKTSKSRGLSDNYLVTCKVCDGKGYVIRYENVRK